MRLRSILVAVVATMTAVTSQGGAMRMDGPETFIIDDQDPRCTFPGGQRFEGPMRDATVNVGITASQTADAKATWKPGVSGRYHLQVQWQTHIGFHEMKAAFTVKSADREPQRFIVNRKIKAASPVTQAVTPEGWMASGWYTLGDGPWMLDADGTVELTRPEPGFDWLVADALRVSKSLVVDELSASAFYLAGEWRLKITQPQVAENTQVALSPSPHACVRVVPGVTGEHRLALSWAADPSNTEQAVYVIDLDGNPKTNDRTIVTIDQRLLADQKTPGSGYAWSGWYELPQPFVLQLTTSVRTRSTMPFSGRKHPRDAVDVLHAPAVRKEVAFR